MMTSLLPPKRYMATIALRAPGCGQPSRHRWHASRPSRVGLRTHTHTHIKSLEYDEVLEMVYLAMGREFSESPYQAVSFSHAGSGMTL